MRIDILQYESQIRDWINETRSKAFICKELSCRPETLNTYLKKLGIEYRGNKSSKGKMSPHKKSALHFTNTNAPIPTSRLRKKLIEEKLKPNHCELCKTYEWQDGVVTLELHHKNGNRYDNSFENLQVLCPNCHSQIPNHKGKT